MLPSSTPSSLQPLLDFLNTLDIEAGADELVDETALQRWLAGNALLPPHSPVAENDFALALRLRDDLRSVLLVQSDEPAPAISNALEKIPLTMTLGADGTPHLVAAKDGVAGALGQLISAIPGAVADGSWARTKVCARDTCRWAFYDGSRNRSRRWCSMEVCGNREKSRNFRDRHDARGGD